MQKAGTRWLYDQLNSHPETWIPAAKELHYFDQGFGPLGQRRLQHNMSRLRDGPAEDSPAARYERELWSELATSDRGDALWNQALAGQATETLQFSAEGLALYRQLFPENVVAGEVTPAYSTLPPDHVNLLSQALPETRFILLVRHPVNRAVSALQMRQRRQQKSAPESPEAERLHLDPALADHFLNRKFVAQRSFPSRILTAWQSVSQERLLVAPFADIVGRPELLRREIGEFIGLESPDRFQLSPTFNKKTTHPKVELSNQVLNVVRDHFANEVRWCRQNLPFASAW